MEQFLCTHCGHRFEAKTREDVVCPKCYWSTSVKREESGEPRGSKPEVQKIAVETPPLTAPNSSRIWFWGGVLVSLALLVGIPTFAFRHLRKQDEIVKKIESENAKVIASKAPELSLLPEEQETLERAIPLDFTEELSESEQGILSYRVPLRSRLIQGLPTPPWDEKQFAEFLKAQEAQYRLPFEWSYRRKLTQLFRDHYISAARAFEAKDYLKARDEWIRSLTFPVYQGDLQKHRGVVLTMLQPYINDTLSKIGMMNSMLTEKDVYGMEEKIRSGYESLHELLGKRSWEEASAQLLELEKALAEPGLLQSPASLPPFPREIGLVDAHIQEVLFAQAAPAQPAERDWQALGGDLAAKEKAIRGRLVTDREAVRKQYEEALAFIKNGEWRAAKELLAKIDFPIELVEDSRSKIKILSKLLGENLEDPEGASLDSQGKSG